MNNIESIVKLSAIKANDTRFLLQYALFYSFVRKFILIIVASAITTPILYAKDNISLSPVNIRKAYLQRETVKFLFNIENRTDSALDNVRLNINIAEVVNIDTHLFQVDSGKTNSIGATVALATLKTGQYNVELKLFDQDTIIASETMPIYICHNWNHDRMRIWLWPHAKFGSRVYEFNNDALTCLNWYIDKGFNSFIPGGGVGQKLNYGGFSTAKFELYDYALYKKIEMGIEGIRSYYLNINDTQFGEACFKNRKKWAGSNIILDPFNKVVAKEIEDANKSIIQAVKCFPAVKVCHLASEVEDYIPSETPLARECYPFVFPAETPHKYIAPGIIANSDKRLIEQRFQFIWGDGLAVQNKRVADIMHIYKPDMFVFSDPVRKTTHYKRYRGMDAVSTWTYSNPDPKRMLYIETLKAVAKPLRQSTIPTVSLFNYPGSIAPEDKGPILMGPDRLVESLWINLSRNPEALGIYIGSACDPLDDNSKYPYQRYPETFEAMKRFIKDIVTPYGPMIHYLTQNKRRLAILSSESSALYRASPNLLGVYQPCQIYNFYSLLAMIHLDADVIFDENIDDDILNNYDILILAKCDTLTESVYNHILKFKEHGGIVVADQYLRADIPDIIKCDFDFTYRKNVTAKAISKGIVNAGRGDTIKSRTARVEKAEGVFAREDQIIMESYAALLKQKLTGIITPHIECDSPTVLLNTLNNNGAEYLFLINDKRDYGKRLGQYKAILEKSVPQKINIKIRDWKADKLYVYDIIEHKLLPAVVYDNEYMCNINLPAPGGKIVALLSQKIDRLEVLAPKSMKKGSVSGINILIKDNNGLLIRGIQPLLITVKDTNGAISEYSGYYAAQSGIFHLNIIPAMNDASGDWTIEIREFISGLCKTISISII